MENTEKGNLIVKSNRLIEASYRLTMYEQQLVLYSIVQARESGIGDAWTLHNTPIVIKVQEFMKAFNITDNSGNVYRYLRDSIKTLFERSVTFYHHVEDSAPATTELRWIWKRTYSDDCGFLSVNFTEDVIKYFTRLEVEFTSYDLKQVGNFTSVYAVRIFELLKQYQKTGKRELTLETLRKTLQLEDAYPLYSALMKWVINPAIEQINKHSDYQVQVKPIKESRKVVALLFTFKSKETTPKKPRQSAMRLSTKQETSVQEEPIKLTNEQLEKRQKDIAELIKRKTYAN
jgi:plasmid replication initiation protein